MKYKVSMLKNWLQVLVFVSFCSLIISNMNLTAAETEEEKEATPVKQEEPVEPIALRHDRIIAKQLEEGEVKWLKSAKSEFLGIFKGDSSGKALGSVLILASPKSAPNSPGALSYLSKELSENGWHTLAISMPEFNFSGPAPKHPKEVKKAEEKSTEQQTDQDDKKQDDKIQEQETKVDTSSSMPEPKTWYEQQQTKNMEKLLERILVSEVELRAFGGKYLILAQGATAELLLELISSKVINPQGLITLNIQHPVNQRMSKIPSNLAKVTISTLDIYNDPTSKYAKKRKLKQKGTNFRQIYVPGNGIHYKGSEALLYKSINGWLKNTFSK